MQDRPTATELLDAVSGFLRERAEHARDRWERFQLQVAANSVSIVARELQMEDAFMRAEWQGLDALLGAEPVPPDQRAFAARLAARNQDLASRITVVDKVRITNPNEQP
jgi:hypothetical protein